MSYLIIHLLYKSHIKQVKEFKDAYTKNMEALKDCTIMTKSKAV